MKATENGTTAAQVKNMTKTFVAYTLGSEPTWKPGDTVTFEFTYRHTNNKWRMTLRREESKYEPYRYALHGTKLLHNGQPTEYAATHGQRYKTMEQAFLHLLNCMNTNANIRNKYKSLEQWFNESEKENNIE